MAELRLLVEQHGVSMHQYADDCQFYLRTTISQTAAAVSKLSECLTDIRDWLSRRRLRLNPSKMQAMWLCSGQQLDKIGIREVSIMSTRVSVEHTVRDLGVIFDSRLSIADHVAACCMSLWLLPIASAPPSGMFPVS